MNISFFFLIFSLRKHGVSVKFSLFHVLDPYCMVLMLNQTPYLLVDYGFAFWSFLFWNSHFHQD